MVLFVYLSTFLLFALIYLFGLYNKLKKKYAPIIDIENEVLKYQDKISSLQTSYKVKKQVYDELVKKVDLYTDNLEMYDIGIYEPHFNYDTSEKFQLAIKENLNKQKILAKNKTAAVCDTEWSVSGSKAEGRKMTNRQIKLTLKAFNGECDTLIKNVSWNNVVKQREKIKKAYNDINNLNETNNIKINKNLLDLKLEELDLNYEYQLKKYEEKEEQRRIREQIREEEKLQKEIERKQKEIEKQEQEEALLKIKLQEAFQQGKEEQAAKYQHEIEELKQFIEDSKRAVSQAQMTKVGHVYVISNIGSFGENVYKIGMTRRLDPQERVDELGDASVPFKFDVHAMIKSDNAPELENKLHELFKNRRVNRINFRKEFFNVSLNEIERAVKEFAGSNIEFIKGAEAKEYRETQAMIEAETPHEIKSIEEFPVEI